MFRSLVLLSAALASLANASANAQGLKPIEAGSFNLGTVTGIIYYTKEAAGYRVVATLQDSKNQTVLRCIVTVAPGQSVIFSTPRGVGAPPVGVTLVRQDGVLLLETFGRRPSTTTGTNLAARP